jgi:hypothetical protein
MAAVRVPALVAAGVTSGYLWRAAFEGESPSQTMVRVAPSPSKISSSEPFVHPPSVDRRPHRAPLRKSPASTQRATGSLRKKAVSPGRSTSPSVTSRPVPVGGTAPSTSPSPAHPPVPPKPSPGPTPTPAPTPTSPSPSVTPVAVPASNSNVGAVSSVRPPQPSGADPSSAQNPPPAESGASRPGWGRGDKNHQHSGPPGQPRK